MKGILRKALNLAIVAVFAITTIAQASPFTTDTLRTVSLANTKTVVPLIREDLKAASAGASYNAQRRLLEEVSKQAKLIDIKVKIDRIIKLITEHFKISITGVDEKTGREPYGPLETLAYWLQTERIRFVVESLDVIDEDKLKNDFRKNGDIAFDKSGTNYPALGQIKQTPYYGAFAYSDDKNSKIKTVLEYKGLSDTEKKAYKPVFFIHISEAYWKIIKDNIEGQFSITIEQAVRHFFPSYQDNSPAAHAEMYKDKSVDYVDLPGGHLISEVKTATKAKDADLLLTFLANYRTFNDPTGDQLTAIYFALDEFKTQDFIDSIKTTGQLIAFYRYLFEHKKALEKVIKDCLGINVNEADIKYENRIVYISKILRANKDNEIIAENIQPGSDNRFFNYMFPNTGDIVYIPQNIGGYVLGDSFEAEELSQANIKKLERLTEEWNSLVARRDALARQIRPQVEQIKRGKDRNKEEQKRIAEKPIWWKEEDASGVTKTSGINAEINRLSGDITAIYDTPLMKRLVPELEGFLREHKGQGAKVPFILALYGPSSAGKTTLADLLRNELVTKGYKADYISSDSYLHPGDDFRYAKRTDGSRFTLIRGQGIYDMEVFAEDIEDLKNGHLIKTPSDEHSRGKGIVEREIDPSIDVLIVDLTVLGLNKHIAEKVDFMLPVVFKVDMIRLARRIERDGRPKEEGGDRALSQDYIVSEFVEKQFQEIYDNMGPLVLLYSNLIWQQDANSSFIHRSKSNGFKKAPYACPATFADASTQPASKGSSAGITQIIDIPESITDIFNERKNNLEVIFKGLDVSFSDFKFANIKLKIIDNGRLLGFVDASGDTMPDGLIYSRRSEDNGITYIEITRAMYALLQPYEDLKKEMADEVKKTLKRADSFFAAGEHSLAQLIMSVLVANKGAYLANARQEEIETALSTEHAKADGTSDIDLFILDNAARDIRAISYLEGLPYNKSVKDALSKAYFLNLSRATVEQNIKDPNQLKKEASASALLMIDSAIEESLAKASIFKKLDIRAIAHEERPGMQEALCYEVAYRLGLSIANNFREATGKRDLTIVVGKDVRLNSESLQQALTDGLRTAGVTVVDISTNINMPYTTTPMISTVVYRKDAMGLLHIDGAVQVTSSHNDFRYGGFKIFFGKENTEELFLKKIVIDAAVLNISPNVDNGKYLEQNFADLYKKEVVKFIRDNFDGEERPLTGKKYAVLGVSGTSGELFAQVLEDCGAEVVRIHCEPNGYFPYGIPDPDKSFTKKSLISAMKDDNTIDAGVAFDSDGDRLFFASKGGIDISNHELECLFADKIRGDVVVNGRTTMAVQDVKTNHGEKSFKAMSGYSFIKAAAREKGAAYGLEESGHFMFEENSYIDDGMKSAAMVFALVAQDEDRRDLKQIIDKDLPFKDYYSFFVISAKLEANNKECTEAKETFTKAESIYFGNLEGCSLEMDDGLRVVFDEDIWGFKGWMQFRQSLSTPQKIYLDFEATQKTSDERYEPSSFGVWQMITMLRERISYYPVLGQAADELSNSKIAENKKIDELTKEWANKTSSAGVIPFNSPEVQAAIRFLNFMGNTTDAARLVYLAKTGRIIMDAKAGAAPELKTSSDTQKYISFAKTPVENVLPEQYYSSGVVRSAHLVRIMSGNSDLFLQNSRTRPEKPMVLAVTLQDWDDNTHCGSLLATPLGFRMACDEALATYGKDLNYLFEQSQVSIGGFSDAGTGKRCSPVSQAGGNSRGSLDMVGKLPVTATERIDLTLILATAIQNSKFARDNYGKTIDVHYASQISVEQDTDAVMDNYERLKKEYDGYDVLVVSVTDKRQSHRQAQAFKKVFGEFSTMDVGKLDLATDKGKPANRFFSKYVAPALASELTNKNLDDLGVYVIDDASGNVIANYPKQTLEAIEADDGSKIIQVKATQEPLSTFDNEGVKTSGPDIAYSYGSHRVSRTYLLALESYFGQRLDGRKALGKGRPSVEAPDVAQIVLLHVKGVLVDDIVKVAGKSKEFVEDIISFADENGLQDGWMGAHKLSEGLLFWWRYRRPLDILNNQLMMLTGIADGIIEVGANGKLILAKVTPQAREEAKAMQNFRGIIHPVASSTFGNVVVDENGIRSDNQQQITPKNVQQGVDIGGVYVKGSVVQDSVLDQGSRVIESVINNVKGRIVVSQSFVDNSVVNNLESGRALVINLVESGDIVVSGASVVDIFNNNLEDSGLPLGKGHARMWAGFDADGKRDANTLLPGNRYTFSEMYDILAIPDTNITETKIKAARKSLPRRSDYAIQAETITTEKAGDLTSYTLTDADSGSSVTIVPGWGATVTSMKVKLDGKPETEVFYYGNKDITKASGGIPVLWPFANRIKDGKFTWAGDAHNLHDINVTDKNRPIVKADGTKRHIYHGMARYAKWSVGRAGVDKDGAYMTCFLNSADYSAMEKHFGKAKITLAYRLKGNQLGIAVNIINNDDKDIPMSFALHPWIKLPLGPGGTKADVKVSLPAKKRWISNAEHIPDGNVAGVKSSRYDFVTKPKVLGNDAGEDAKGENLPDTFDDVFTGLEFKDGIATSVVYDPKNKIKVEVSQTEGFKQVVLNVPNGKPAVCVEPQTSATDAFNLDRTEVKEQANLVVLKPGETFEGMVSIKTSKFDESETTDSKASSAGYAFEVSAIGADIESYSTAFISTEPSLLDMSILLKTIQSYELSLQKLNDIRQESPEGAGLISEPINRAEAFLNITTLSKDIAAREAAINDVEATILINPTDIPDNQKILLALLKKDNSYLRALEQKLGCKIRLLIPGQYDPATDSSANMIAISKSKIQGMPGLKYLNIHSLIDNAYLPLEQAIVFAKGLIVYSIDSSGETASTIAQMYKILTKKPILESVLKVFLEDNIFVLELPKPLPVDEKHYEELHKQAIAALIAA